MNFTFKHLNSFFDDETLDHGQFGKNQVRVFKDLTTDMFTQTFLDKDENVELRYMFIDYCFYEIYSDIKILLNVKLIESGSYPLSGDENVYLIFKGGTVMNITYYKALENLKNLNQHKNSSINNIKFLFENKYRTNLQFNQNIDLNETLFHYIDEKISTNFKVSDIDFSIYIQCNTNRRFILIHNIIVSLLLSSLSKISKFFDTYFKHILDNKYNPNPQLPADLQYYNDINIDNYDHFNFIEKNEVVNYLNNYIKILLRDMKTYIHLKQFDRINIAILQNTLINNIIILYNDMRHRILYNIINIKNIRTLLLYFETIYYISYINTINNGILNNNLMDINIVLQYLQSQINNHIDNKKGKIIRNNFYTIAKIDNFMIKINDKYIGATHEISLYNDKFDTSFANTNIAINKYKATNFNIVQDPNHELFLDLNDFENRGKLKIMPRLSTIFTANNDGIEQEKIYNYNPENNSKIQNINFIQNIDALKRYHYITYNNIISKARNLNSVHVNFDLARIKFNVVLNNVIKKNNSVDFEKDYKIPSEFLDVSIPKYLDNSRISFLNDINHHGLNISHIIHRNKDYFYDSYSAIDLYKDLEFVLFMQNSSLPWIDTKYTKRIKRLVVYALLSNDNNNNTIQNFIEVLLLTNNILTYMNNHSSFPYNIFTKFISSSSTLYSKTKQISTINEVVFTKYKIEDMLNILPNERYDNLIKINNKYQYFSKYIVCLIFWSRLYHDFYINNNIPNNDEILNIINKFRNNYLFNNYTDINILQNIFDKFKELLEEFLHNGILLTYLYDNYL